MTSHFEIYEIYVTPDGGKILSEMETGFCFVFSFFSLNLIVPHFKHCYDGVFMVYNLQWPNKLQDECYFFLSAIFHCYLVGRGFWGKSIWFVM